MVKEKKDKKAKKKPTEAERVIEAYYMLARTIDHNTQVFNAFIDMISAKEAEEKKSPKNPPIDVYTKDDVAEVLTNIVEACGKEQAVKFLDSFDAKTISEVCPTKYDVFIKSGNYMIKHYKGDVI
tara:strand:- start:292 stop:666 length:375 start_codon:yes stop_codon:yes gene_type:complete